MADEDLGTLMQSVDEKASKKATGEPAEKTEAPAEQTEDKKGKKDKKDKKKDKEEKSDDEKLGFGGHLIMAFVVLIIIAIWLGIFALVVKMDIGGFGSTVLFPVLKDVPYVNQILPGIEDYLPQEEVDDAYNYATVDEAVARIKELEKQVDDLKATQSENEDYIKELEAAKEELATYKANEASFEEEKEKFYEEVVFSDSAPDINEYKSYYESIEPDNAEEIYKQVVTQLQEDEELADYVDTYSTMKAKNAAAIFDSMTDNYDLVCEILSAMDASTRADILAAMDESNAAIITQMMEP